MSDIAIIGHGLSPEGRGWGARIDRCDVVVRLWDCHWQNALDHGEKYDWGLFEISPNCFGRFSAHNVRQPSLGWVASYLKGNKPPMPPRTEVISQIRWTEQARQMGGIGATGKLRFTRGTVATCWAIGRAKAGDRIVLVGFDNIQIGRTLPRDEAFSVAYQGSAGSLSCDRYDAGVSRWGNHDFAVERPFMERLAGQRQVTIQFARDIW